MKNTDLRIGNLIHQLDVDFNKHIKKVDLYVLEFVECSLYDGDYEPIELNEEWLLKFGFKRSNDNLFYLPMPQMKSEIHYEKHSYGNVITLQSSVGMFIPNDIDYVHQLQNLYFALTGEELTL